LRRIARILALACTASALPALALGLADTASAATAHRAPATATASSRIAHSTVSPGTRIVRIARRYVGHARYVEGGASPKRGFDCSGYTRWVYSHARVATLPHNAEAQRHVKHMHKISRKAARPGDLIFYFSGRSAYHVAIYAGHGRQYAAATPRDGIRYQAIWSTNVEFRTDWH
jgi:cell wall-associated NlpC family hydrolase